MTKSSARFTLLWYRYFYKSKHRSVPQISLFCTSGDVSSSCNFRLNLIFWTSCRARMTQRLDCRCSQALSSILNIERVSMYYVEIIEGEGCLSSLIKLFLFSPVISTRYFDSFHPSIIIIASLHDYGELFIRYLLLIIIRFYCEKSLPSDRSLLIFWALAETRFALSLAQIHP